MASTLSCFRLVLSVTIFVFYNFYLFKLFYRIKHLNRKCFLSAYEDSFNEIFAFFYSEGILVILSGLVTLCVFALFFFLTKPQSALRNTQRENFVFYPSCRNNAFYKNCFSPDDYRITTDTLHSIILIRHYPEFLSFNPEIHFIFFQNFKHF